MDELTERLIRIEAKLDRLLENEEKLAKERAEVTEALKGSPFGAILAEVNK